MILTIYKSEWEAYTRPDQIIDASWDDIADMLCDFNQKDKKEDVLMFNLWELNPNGEQGRKYLDELKETWDYRPGTIRRCTENLVGLHGLVLDFDNHLTIDQAIQQVEGLEYVIYTTFNHSEAKHKFRIVIPFTRMMTLEEFEMKVDDMKACWPKADNASFSKSQAIFFHSGKDPKQAIAFRYSGAKIDPDMFISKAPAIIIPNPIVYVPQTDQQKEAYKQMIYNSLLTCSNVNRSGPGEGVLLCNICRSAGFTFDEFSAMCNMIGREGSSIKTIDVQKQFWILVGDKAKVRAITRDAFINAHGGVLVKPLTNIKTMKIRF